MVIWMYDRTGLKILPEIKEPHFFLRLFKVGKFKCYKYPRFLDGSRGVDF